MINLNVIYKEQFYPLLECCVLLEVFCNERNYQDYISKLLNDDDAEKEQMMEVLKTCEVMKNEMGKCFTQNFEKYSTYFKIYGKSDLSPIMQFIYTYHDFSITDPFAQLQFFYDVLNRDENCFIRAYVMQEDEDHNVQKMDKEALLESFQNLEINDGDRWKIWSMHMQFKHVLDVIADIMRELMPIYKSHKEAMQKCYAMFEQDKNKVYPQGNMYDNLKSELGISYEEEGKDIIIIPSFALCVSISFIDRIEFYTNDIYILWGTLSSKNIKNKRRIITMEQMCAGLKLLSDKSKFEILCYVANEKAYGAQIAKELKLTTPTISYHMQSLVNVGFISFEKLNNRLYYKAEKEYIAEFLEIVRNKLFIKSY